MKACSAVLSVLPVGVFITTMPRRVAASLSMLSVPTPARAMARRRLLPSRTSAADRDAAAADGAVELGQGLFQGVALEAGADFVVDAGGFGGVEQVEAFLGDGVEDDDASFGHWSVVMSLASSCRWMELVVGRAGRLRQLDRRSDPVVTVDTLT